jgi:hypothetical protein
VTWNALGRVTEAAVAVVSNPQATRMRPTHPHHPSDATATRAGCLWCDINALRAALVDAGTPGVGGGPESPATLLVNPSDSRCGTCGRPALPREATHKTAPGYGGPEPGCGARWTHLSSDYGGGDGLHEAARALRPDLTWVSPLAAEPSPPAAAPGGPPPGSGAGGDPLPFGTDTAAVLAFDPEDESTGLSPATVAPKTLLGTIRAAQRQANRRAGGP